MKIDKVQKDLITMFYNCDEDRILYNVIEDKKEVHITTDGFLLHIIPESYFWLDINKFEKRCRRFDTTKLLLNDIKKYKTAEYTGLIIEKGKISLAQLKVDDFETYVNVSLLKKYYNIRNIEFKVIEPLKPVLIYENNTLCGLIMPVKC